MPEYIYVLHPFRDGFFEHSTPEENIVMEEHLEYLTQAVEAGAVILAGPCLDQTFGLVVFRAADEGAARAFMFNDPAVKKNVLAAELHPLRIALRGP